MLAAHNQAQELNDTASAAVASAEVVLQRCTEVLTKAKEKEQLALKKHKKWQVMYGIVLQLFIVAI